mgnify:FL=1
MATTLELPNDVWDIIVKQSKQSITDLLTELSIAELTEVVLKADREKEKRLRCVRNKYPRYAIINDAYNQKWIITDGTRSPFGGERYVNVERVYYTTDTTIIGNYHKNSNGEENIYDSFCAKIDLSNQKLIINNCNNTPIDFKIIQYQDDISANRITRADNLEVGDTFHYFKHVISMTFCDTSWDYNSKQLGQSTVIKKTAKYIFYDLPEWMGGNLRKKVEKRYVIC